MSLFFLYPLFLILDKSLNLTGSLNIEAFSSLLADKYYLGRIWFTFWQALASTIITLIIGIPLALIFARYEFHGKTLLKAMVTIPFVLPTIVVAMGFLSLIGPDGILNKVMLHTRLISEPLRMTNSLFIILAAHTFYNYAIVIRIVSAVWSNLDPFLEETAKVLGSGRFRTFFYITLPLLLPAIISSALLIFTFSFTSFGVVLVLGGPGYATMEVSIFELTAKLFKLPMAGALSIIQIVFTCLFFFIYSKFQEKTTVSLDIKPRGMVVKRLNKVSDFAIIIIAVFAILTLLSPLIALLIRSVSLEGGYATTQVANLFSNERGSYFYVSPLRIVANSVFFGLATVVISLIIGTLVGYFLARSKNARGSLIDTLFMLPLGVSAVTIGFGYILAMSGAPVDIRGSWIALIIAHSLVAYPFVIRSILPVLKGIDPDLRQAAALLGANARARFLSIDLPIIAPSLLVGATFAFAISIGEFGASILLVDQELMTLPIAIFRFLSLPGEANLGKALAMSNLLTVIVAVSFMAIERFRYKGIGSF